jgi:hypothetical protein
VIGGVRGVSSRSKPFGVSLYTGVAMRDVIGEIDDVREMLLGAAESLREAREALQDDSRPTSMGQRLRLTAVFALTNGHSTAARAVRRLGVLLDTIGNQGEQIEREEETTGPSVVEGE